MPIAAAASTAGMARRRAARRCRRWARSNSSRSIVGNDPIGTRSLSDGPGRTALAMMRQ